MKTHCRARFVHSETRNPAFHGILVPPPMLSAAAAPSRLGAHLVNASRLPQNESAIDTGDAIYPASRTAMIESCDILLLGMRSSAGCVDAKDATAWATCRQRHGRPYSREAFRR
jgi:hypothetical protein